MSANSCSQCPMAKGGIPTFDPLRAVEGYKESPVWIVGLNPKVNESDMRKGSPNPVTWANVPQSPSQVTSVPHFRRLKRILGDDWFTRLLQPNGIAHTDLVKCGSPRFGETERKAIQHCRGYLVSQIRARKPRLLLVLSADASQVISKEAGFPEYATEGQWKIGGESTYVLLSGYTTPMQDRYAKMRLRRDFLNACVSLNL